MSKNKYDKLQECFDWGEITVDVLCEADVKPPEGKELKYDRGRDAYYVDGEVWHVESRPAYIGPAGEFYADDVAREIEKLGWSFKAGVGRCPHCTKRDA